MPAVFTVNKSSRAIVDITVEEFFQKRTNVQVSLIKGFGSYQYQLDAGLFQASNSFSYVTTGVHLLKIKDIYGSCGITEIEFLVLDYPKFFTPNGDGVSDVWNVWDLEQQEIQLQIFDRYGKHVGSIMSNDLGWDGNYNGYSLPSADYWFSLKYPINGKIIPFNSHFSLKK